MVKHNATTHGYYHHPLYNTWKGMMYRTTNPSSASYVDYGGRGISVCSRWSNVKNFCDDMMDTYSDGMSIDRVDNNGNYEPSNCRWTTATIQSRNTRMVQKNNTSGYRGVSVADKRWRAQICVNRKCIVIGRFDTKIDAASAYNRYVIDNNLEHTLNEFKESR